MMTSAAPGLTRAGVDPAVTLPADPGCTPVGQLSTTGGKLENIISSIGLLVLVLAALAVGILRQDPATQPTGAHHDDLIT